jgi:hypothetical protein
MEHGEQPGPTSAGSRFHLASLLWDKNVHTRLGRKRLHCRLYRKKWYGILAQEAGFNCMLHRGRDNHPGFYSSSWRLEFDRHHLTAGSGFIRLFHTTEYRSVPLFQVLFWLRTCRHTMSRRGVLGEDNPGWTDCAFVSLLRECQAFKEEDHADNMRYRWPYDRLD